MADIHFDYSGRAFDLEFDLGIWLIEKTLTLTKQGKTQLVRFEGTEPTFGIVVGHGIPLFFEVDNDADADMLAEILDTLDQTA